MMNLETKLNNMLKDNKSFASIFKGERKVSDQELNDVKYAFDTFNREFMVKFVSAPIAGRYLVDRKHYMVKGIAPLTTKELTVYMLYACLVIFQEEQSVKVITSFIAEYLNRTSTWKYIGGALEVLNTFSEDAF